MTRLRAVLLDALGTLVELRPPAPRLRALLERSTGVDVGARGRRARLPAEIAYYLDHHLQGGDREGLERLRDDCAEVMRQAIGHDALERGAVRARCSARWSSRLIPTWRPR